MPLERKIGMLLTKKRLTLSIAESCTGGLLSHIITDIPKSSAYFNGSLVCYSQKAKAGLLRIPERLINRHGTVSAETAKAMAEAVRRLIRTRIGLAVTGVAGPDLIEGKPAGLVYIALSYNKKTYVQEFKLRGTREKIKKQAAKAALEFLWKHLKD